MPKIDESIFEQDQYPERNFFDIPEEKNSKIKKIDKSIFKKSQALDINNKKHKQDKSFIIKNRTDNNTPKKELPQSLCKEENDYNVDTEPTVSLIEKIQRLHGMQKKIFYFIVNLCEENGDLKTGPLNMETLISYTSSTVNTVRSSIRRLIKKDLIEKIDWHTGRGGFSVFGIQASVKKSAINLIKIEKNNIKLSPMNLKSYSSEESQSLSPDNKSHLPKSWQYIDTSPLDDIKFGESNLIQIHREFEGKPHLKLSTDIIQDSINAMAYDIKHNNASDSFRYSPALVLTSILKKGIPYTSKTPDKYLSPKEDAMRIYLSVKENERKRVKDLEAKVKELEFESWENNLSEDDVTNILGDNLNTIPRQLGAKTKEKIIRGHLKARFDDSIWPDIKRRVMSNNPLNDDSVQDEGI